MPTYSQIIQHLPTDLSYRALAAAFRKRHTNIPPPPFAVSRKVLFIHIPKCAGISVCAALYGGDTQIGHARFRDYSEAGLARHPDLLHFTIVRNPWDRALSAYRFLQAGGLGKRGARYAPDRILSRYINKHFSDFRSFVVGFIGAGRHREFFHFEPQVDYLKDRQGRIVDSIVRHRLEDISKAGTILLPSGEPLALPRHNVSREDGEDYRLSYDDRTRSIIADAYAEDIRLLGYAF